MRPKITIHPSIKMVCSRHASSLMAGLLGLTLFAGCQSTDNQENSVAALSRCQAIGKGDSTDMADHDCRVVLRSVDPLYQDGMLQKTCDDEGCRTVLVVQVDVAVGLKGSVYVLFHSAESGRDEWRQVQAQPTEPGGAGFQRYEARIIDPLPTIESGSQVDLIPFVSTGQGRLFDHNVVTDDLDSYHLPNVSGYLRPSSRICTHRPATSELRFDTNWAQFPVGQLRAGQKLAIHYSPSRLPDCRNTHNGFPAWGMEAFVKFLPGEQVVSGPVVAFRNDQGRPISDFYAIPFITEIPEDARSVEVWFHNTSGAGSTCESWDSNYGANYRFEVRPPRSQDPCADRWLWQRDGQVQPFCPEYEVAANYDATTCEFFLSRISNVETGHYGIPQHWLEVDLQTTATAGNVTAVGIYVQYLDRSDGTEQQAWVFGRPGQSGIWHSGFDYLTTIYPDAGHLYEVSSFAFFLDQRRQDGTIVRLWLSRSGANYTWDDAFGAHTHVRHIPYGRAYDADSSAPVFDNARACR